MSIPKGFVPEEKYNEKNETQRSSISDIPEGFIEEANGLTPKTIKAAQGFKFFGYQPKAETIEKIRHPAGVGLRAVAKGTLGTYGEFAQLAQRPFTKKPIKVLPDTETIANFFDKTSGEDFSPRNVPEEFLDRGLEFLGASLGLGGIAKASSTAYSLGKTMLRAFVPGGVSLTAEKMNLPPWMQAAATIGTGILTHKFTSTSLKDVARQWHQRARELGKDVMIDSEPAMEALEQFKAKHITPRLKDSPTRQFLSKIVGSVEEKMLPRMISADDWMAVNSSLNDFAMDASQLPGGKKLLGGVKSIVQDLDKQLKRANPEFLKSYRQANSLTKGLYESKYFENYLMNNKKVFPVAGGVLGLIKYATGAELPSIGKSIGVAAISKGAEIASALYRNQGLRKAYFGVVRNAISENTGGTLKSLKAFNEVAKKEGIDVNDNR